MVSWARADRPPAPPRQWQQKSKRLDGVAASSPQRIGKGRSSTAPPSRFYPIRLAASNSFPSSQTCNATLVAQLLPRHALDDRHFAGAERGGFGHAQVRGEELAEGVDRVAVAEKQNDARVLVEEREHFLTRLAAEAAEVAAADVERDRIDAAREADHRRIRVAALLQQRAGAVQ